MLVGAVAGETSSLTIEEKQKVTEFCVNHNNNRIPLIVGVVQIIQRRSNSFVKIVEEAGADGFMPSAK